MRHAKLNDLERIVHIYNSSIASRMSTADTEPVTLESKIEWFQSHSNRYPIFVTEDAGRVVGWVSFEEFYGRPAYHLTAEISLYVDPQYQGRGIGSGLLKLAIQECSTLGIKNIAAYIFSHNAPSISLFEKNDFVEWGQLPNIAQMDGQLFSLSILGLSLGT